jgi:flagellar hook assembly protein FlgD
MGASIFGIGGNFFGIGNTGYGSPILKLASTGEATFSGKTNIVKSHSDYALTVVNTDSNGYGLYIQAGSTNNAIDVYNASGTTQLFKLTGTGAATFSSSVKVGAGLNITGITLSSGANYLEMGTDATSYSINAINRSSGNYNYPFFIDAQKLILNNGSGGNVLIGTTTDAGYKLDVNGTGRFGGNTSSSPFELANTTISNYLFINSTTGNEAMTRYYNPTAGNWYTGIRVTAGLGSTSSYHIYSSSYGNDVFVLNTDGSAAFANKISVTGTGGDNDPVLALNSSSSATFQWISRSFNASQGAGQNLGHWIGKSATQKNSGSINFQWNGNSSDTNKIHFGMYGADYLLNILANGNVGIGSTSPSYQLQLSTDSAAKPSTNTWTIASDSRVKENITPYTKGLSAIMAINPINYDYNGKAGFSVIKNNIGVIAQDVLEILPESVSTYQAKLNEDDLEDTELYNFNSHALTYVLINAIKEQQAQIEELKLLIK